jgi:hypothetical protein
LKNRISSSHVDEVSSAHGCRVIAFRSSNVVPLLPLGVWLWFHPTLLRELLQNYAVMTSAHLAERVSLYWDYFNPSYLLFSGGSDPMWPSA